MNKKNFMPTEFIAKASKALSKEVEDELNIEDPEVALSTFIADTEQIKRKEEELKKEEADEDTA